MSEISINSLMQYLQQSFIPEKAIGMSARIQLELEGNPAEFWFMTISDQKCLIEPGQAQNPRVSLSITQQDLLGLLNGSLDPMRAFFSGKIHVHGDRSFLLKLPALFSIDPDQLLKK